MTNSPFGFDPSKMDPQVMMELSQLVRELPPEKLNQMQTLMHNAMAGYDVRQQMEEFERSLPAGFREKIVALMARNPIPVEQPVQEQAVSSKAMNEREARLTVLRAVAEGRMSPEEAEKLL